MNGDGAPPTWERTHLGALIDGFETGRNLRAHGRPASATEYGVLKISAVSWGRFKPEENKALLAGDTPRPHEIVRSGDLLISRANTTELVGAVVRVEKEYPRLMLPDKVLRLRVRTSVVEPAFLLQALRLPSVREQFAANATGTSDSMRNLSQPKIEAAAIILPPLNEQRRIVAKLEALQARSRRAREALDAVPPLLEKLRQSILAAAFRGDLTKDWRAKHKDVEPASELLKRIRIERRKKWEEAELAKMKAKGKAPTDDNWKAKYKEPKPVDATRLPTLPEGWCWASVEELSTKVVDGVHKKPNYVSSGVPFLTVKNLTAGQGISFDDLNYVSRHDHEEFIKRTDPEFGDILISKDGTLGVTRLIRTGATFSIFVSLALVKPVRRTMSEYLEAAFVSPFFQERFKATGSGLLHIHLVDLRAAALPVAPLEEQEVVTARAQDALRLLDAHAGRHSEIEAAVATLDRTTIAKAFRGELVRQDPNDEPAEAMLARVHPSNGSSSTTMHRRSTEHERDASHRMLGQTPSDAESRSKVSYRRRWPRG